jgi:signal transduction histidine kinase
MIVNGEASGERATQSARVIVEQASHMAGLIRQLLDFSRHRAPRFGVLSCRALCARTVDTLRVVARRRRVTIAAELPEDPLFVSADEHQLQQAVVNLLVNAMQAVPDGGRITVTTGTRRTAPPGGAPEADFVWLAVHDDGPGIPPEHLERLFEPFFTTKAPGEGTGLGLAVAHGIVRDHGGWIDVESAPGRGSTFTIWLPAAAAAQTPPHRAA